MTSIRPRLAIGLPAGESAYRADEQHKIIDLARAADAAGIDTLVQSDHVIMGERLDRYPWGTFRLPNGSPWLEPITLLSVIAGATSRIRLSTGIVLAALRRAPLFAKQTATLDALSRGRLELGVGTGWQQEEYEVLDLDFENRVQLLDDTISACRALWAPGAATVGLPTISFGGVWCDPKPAQQNGIPILFSGHLTGRNLRRITELGDGWIPLMGEPTSDVAAGIAKIRDAWAANGRGSETPRVRHALPLAQVGGPSHDLARTLEGAAELAAVGVTEVLVPASAFLGDGQDAIAWIADLAKRWERLWS